MRTINASSLASLIMGLLHATADAAQGTTAPKTDATPEAPKETIAQKVEKLQADKTRLTTEMNAAPEGDAKSALSEQITVIDRKLRWYAGRSGEGKAKAAKNPTKGSRQKKATAATAATPATPAPAATAANES